MKATLITIILFLLVVLWNISCTDKTGKTTELSLMNDITDPLLAQPDSGEIMNLLSMDNIWNGYIVRYSDVTDISFNHTSEVIIDQQSELLGNEIVRKKEIRNFVTKVSTQLSQTLSNKNSSKNNSSIYFPIAQELNRLAKSKSDKRILVIYSDLMENSLSLSFYIKKDFERLISDPESIQKQLEQNVKLPTLQGIDIHLIYQPRDNKGDLTYQVVSGFYKKMLEDKGAKVTISANLN